LRKRSFTTEEDKMLYKLVQEIGPKFNKLLSHFPSRTYN